MPPLRRLAPLLLTALAVGVAAMWLSRADERPPASGTVVRVIDGDTIVVDGGHGRQTVRLLGIDTPETVDPRRPVGCYGPEASSYTKHLLTGRRVVLRYDRELHDRYGRWLAYVYTSAPRPLFVNARLLELGFARTMSIAPNLAHREELAKIESRAALSGRGLWSACG
jgi:micrococcal nuclease